VWNDYKSFALRSILCKHSLFSGSTTPTRRACNFILKSNYHKVTVPCEFDRLQGKEFTKQIDGTGEVATAAIQAKNSQVNTGHYQCVLFDACRLVH